MLKFIFLKKKFDCSKLLTGETKRDVPCTLTYRDKKKVAFFKIFLVNLIVNAGECRKN